MEHHSCTENFSHQTSRGAKSNEEEVERTNTTLPTEFILLGLFNQTESHTFLVAMILLAFITALSGNSLLIFLIQTDSSLHSPMYFFLSHLAFMDICQILIVVPKMAMDSLIPGNTISIVGCGTQIFLTMTMGGAVCLLLAVMSYDRCSLSEAINQNSKERGTYRSPEKEAQGCTFKWKLSPVNPGIKSSLEVTGELLSKYCASDIWGGYFSSHHLQLFVLFLTLFYCFATPFNSNT
ncbi:olfactory receptor 2M7-like [Mauremys reevesii]|uniref:olfactory receptor 2M7-like n=1 Tax=Mauremys reevesii TaxID=260615 RepID=UPI00193FD0C6|nr:olfactory receptor 2M7-like [Mauremys reevesii]